MALSSPSFVRCAPRHVETVTINSEETRLNWGGGNEASCNWDERVGGGVETSRRIVSAEEQSDHLPTVKPIWRRFCAWEVFNAAVCNGLCNLESISFIIRNAPLRPRDSCVKSISCPCSTLANGRRFYERGERGGEGAVVGGGKGNKEEVSALRFYSSR